MNIINCRNDKLTVGTPEQNINVHAWVYIEDEGEEELLPRLTYNLFFLLTYLSFSLSFFFPLHRQTNVLSKEQQQKR